MRVWEFEDAVWNREGVRIVIRANSDTQVEEYGYANAAPRTWSVSELIRNRISSLVDDEEVVAIRGDGTRAYGNTTLRRLRESYQMG